MAIWFWHSLASSAPIRGRMKRCGASRMVVHSAQRPEKEVDVEWDESGGVRHGVRPKTVSSGRVGRPTKRVAEHVHDNLVQRRRQLTQYRWSAVGRDEYSGKQRDIGT